jgi:hypothetical protein
LQAFHVSNRHQHSKISNVNISPATNSASSAQEALETAAQTRAEAAKGDQQAMRRIAKMAPAPSAAAAPVVTEAAPTPSIPPDSTGVVLNVKA